MIKTGSIQLNVKKGKKGTLILKFGWIPDIRPNIWLDTGYLVEYRISGQYQVGYRISGQIPGRDPDLTNIWLETGYLTNI